MKKTVLLAALLALAGSLACVTTGPGGDTSLIIISDEEEVAIGKEVDADVRSKEKIFGDAQWQSYLNEVGQKIVSVSDRQGIEYHFAVIESDQINAFATPGGYVYFYTGILKLMEDESEMAAVLAHEISHVVARHSVQHLQKALGIQLLASVALGEKSAGALGQVTGVLAGLWLNGYGRSYELQADEYGVHYMKEAGYNPDGARTMFHKLATLSGGGEQGWFEKLTTSHPDTQERLTKINAQIAAMPRSVDNLPKNKERYSTMKKRLP
jgi:predicted Zn-dependent protease